VVCWKLVTDYPQRMSALTITSRSTILVLGKPRELAQLVGRLVCGFDKLIAGGADIAELVELNSVVLQTKYYKATVELAYSRQDAQQPGAVITVLPSCGASVDELIASNDEEEASDCPIQLLAVVKQAGQDSLTEEERYKCSVWALDHSCEFVEIDMENVTATHDEREKEGLPRLIEALHANMWSGMERKAASSVEPTAEGGAPVPIQTRTADEDKDKDTDKDHNKDDDGEDMLEKFSELLANARDFREKSSQLSDEERRERAAEFALKFSAILEGEDDDED
jgi:Alpha and gamma adaptin binding protein p34